MAGKEFARDEPRGGPVGQRCRAGGPPGGHRKAWLLSTLLCVVLLLPIPGEGREIRALFDLAHAPTFGALALTILSVIRSRLSGSPLRANLLCWATAVAIGGAIESLQGMTGRISSWDDALADASGAGAFLIWGSTPKASSRVVRIGLYSAGVLLLVGSSVRPLLVLTDAATQGREMPMLASFEHPFELSRWEFQDSRGARSRLHATEGTRSLRLIMGRGIYPGATLAWPARDWSGYRSLEFDSYLEAGPGCDLVVKIEDMRHDGRYGDRYQRVVHLEPGPNQTRIALSEVESAPEGRLLDLRRVRRLQLFTVRPAGPRTIFLDDIRLR